jgi:adenylate kinase
MIIAVSGTPGAGKTAISEELAALMDANQISITELSKKIPHGYDRKRKSRIIDIKVLQREINRKIIKGRINIIDGHLSHLLKSDIVIIIRCNPRVLKMRMEKKGWPAAKIRENIEAELLDQITIEAIRRHRNVFEIDSSRISASTAAKIAKKIILNKYNRKKYRPGSIDWTRKYTKTFLQMSSASRKTDSFARYMVDALCHSLERHS